MGFSSVGEAIPELANLTSRAPNPFPILAGGQNFTHCCLVAMNQSFNVNGPNGSLAFNTPAYFAHGLTVNQLQSSIAADGIPCGAVYEGDEEGVPVVRVPYDWCRSECGGWQKSKSNVLSQWVGPLVQFIIPSLAFCLNVPRARKLALPDNIFQTNSRNVFGIVTYLLKLTYAIFLTTVDTVIWLSVCFAYAGPMLLSAVYEYMLDRKVLEFLSPQNHNDNAMTRPAIPRRLRAQLLLAVVVGNLRLSTGRRRSMISGTSLQSEDLERARTGTFSTISSPLGSDTWAKVMTILDDNKNVSGTDVFPKVPLSEKIKAILNSQPDFGETIGAPILFFVGAFIYTTIDTKNSYLGDGDSAHALAFGMWYMTMTVLAIISCAMLASGNPTALQGMVWDGGKASPRPKQSLGRRQSIQSKMDEYTPSRWLLQKFRGYELLKSTYEGNFEPASLWNRGHNKRRWVHEAIKDYALHYSEIRDGGSMPPKEISRALKERVVEIVNGIVTSLTLLVLPSALAFITSYNTPRKGVSCRTLSYLVYGICQVLECALWIWEIWLKNKYGDRWSEAQTRAKAINYCGQLFVGFWAIFAAVIGTLLQLLGVFRTCVCMVPVSYWLYPHAPGSYVDLSTGDRASLLAAMQYWIPTSITAVGLISLLCAVGWWHQRSLRELFREEADILDENGSQMPVMRFATVEGVEFVRQDVSEKCNP